MGNRVEDGNRAKNWVVQTSSIRGPVFIFAQRMPSLSFSLSSALRFLAVSPSSRAPARCFFFHSSTVLDFLPFCNLEKIIFFRLGVVVSFPPARRMVFDVFLFFLLLFFFFFFSGKRFCLFVESNRQGSLLDGFAFYLIV